MIREVLESHVKNSQVRSLEHRAVCVCVCVCVHLGVCYKLVTASNSDKKTIDLRKTVTVRNLIHQTVLITSWRKMTKSYPGDLRESLWAAIGDTHPGKGGSLSHTPCCSDTSDKKDKALEGLWSAAVVEGFCYGPTWCWDSVVTLKVTIWAYESSSTGLWPWLHSWRNLLTIIELCLHSRGFFGM